MQGFQVRDRLEVKGHSLFSLGRVILCASVSFCEENGVPV